MKQYNFKEDYMKQYNIIWNTYSPETESGKRTLIESLVICTCSTLGNATIISNLLKENSIYGRTLAANNGSKTDSIMNEMIIQEAWTMKYNTLQISLYKQWYQPGSRNKNNIKSGGWSYENSSIISWFATYGYWYI